VFNICLNFELRHYSKDVPDVEPQVQAGILARAAAAVSAAVGRNTHKTGCVSATDPGVVLRELVSRGILRKSLTLAERLVGRCRLTR
jgi:hypothetical protein